MLRNHCRLVWLVVGSIARLPPIILCQSFTLFILLFAVGFVHAPHLPRLLLRRTFASFCLCRTFVRFATRCGYLRTPHLCGCDRITTRVGYGSHYRDVNAPTTYHHIPHRWRCPIYALPLRYIRYDHLRTPALHYLSRLLRSFVTLPTCLRVPSPYGCRFTLPH